MSSRGRGGIGRGKLFWPGPGAGARSLAALLLGAPACVRGGAGPGASGSAGDFPAPRRSVASPLIDVAGDERRRDQDGEAAYVFDALRLVPGMRVADIGAGTGYYTMRLAARLGPASLVYAQETDPAELALLGARADRQRLLNVIPVQGYPSDPALPPGSVDVALLAHSYHQVPDPYQFLHRLAGALAPAGRVGVIGFDRQSIRYGLPPAVLECEFEALGYRAIGFYLLTPGEAYLAVFEAPEQLPEPSAIVPCESPGPPPEP